MRAPGAPVSPELFAHNSAELPASQIVCLAWDMADANDTALIALGDQIQAVIQNSGLMVGGFVMLTEDQAEYRTRWDPKDFENRLREAIEVM